ncbi:MAG: glycosyltransferase [Betaproteobacteria bacterium]|nr:glycosyltransferase [Betaproteobacteria bacterium]
MKILIVSPTPTHPSSAGNRARVGAIARALKDARHTVHFALVPMESGDLAAMNRFFEGRLTVLPYRAPSAHRGWRTRLRRRVLAVLARASAYVWGVDDWYDNAISAALAELHAKERFDVVIVVYVFLSKALDALPDTVLKVLDTNDRFADRHLHYLRKGQTPRWFSTTQEEERRGLARADVVVAIQETERRIFSDILQDAARVVTIGHLVQISDPLLLARRPCAVFVGSDNPINQEAVEYFVAEVLPRVRTMCPNFELWLVGDVCRRIEDAVGIVKKGRVDDLATVYMEASLAVNPVRMGTGLNVKTVECLALGLPLVVTEAGSRGLEGLRGKAFLNVPDDDPSAMADAIVLLLREPEVAASYARKAHWAAHAWNGAQHAGLLALIEQGTARTNLPGNENREFEPQTVR